MGLISLYDFYKKVIPPRNLIIQASEITGEDKNDKFNYSIGLSYNFWRLDMIDQQKIQIGNHRNLVMCCFNYDTDQKRRGNEKINRKVIHNTLFENDILNKKIKYFDYIKNLSEYKFVISPEGNGRDCHRHYEAILCGCIPIIEYNEDIAKKYKNLPVLYTRDYSEITPKYLNKMYQSMIFQKYNFSKLFLNYFSEKEIREINQKSNYWKNKII